MSNTYQVLYDKLLVERLPEEKEKAGIYFPDKYREKQSIGTVLEVGEGRLNPDGSLSPLLVKAGETVIFNKFAGAELPDEDRELLILREDEVLAKVNQAPHIRPA